MKQFRSVLSSLKPFWQYIVPSLLLLSRSADYLSWVPDGWKQHLVWVIPQWRWTGWVIALLVLLVAFLLDKRSVDPTQQGNPVKAGMKLPNVALAGIMIVWFSTVAWEHFRPSVTKTAQATAPSISPLVQKWPSTISKPSKADAASGPMHVAVAFRKATKRADTTAASDNKTRAVSPAAASAQGTTTPPPEPTGDSATKKNCPILPNGFNWTDSTISSGGHGRGLLILGDPSPMNFCATNVIGGAVLDRDGKSLNQALPDSGKPEGQGQSMLAQPTAPGLRLNLNQYGFSSTVVRHDDGTSLVDTNGVTALVIATIGNTGLPSVASDWELSIKLPGQATTLKPGMLAFRKMTDTDTISLGLNVQTTFGKLLYRQTISPLAMGDQKQGFLAFFVPGKTLEEVTQIGTSMILSCRDVSGKTITSDAVAFRGGGGDPRPSLGLE